MPDLVVALGKDVLHDDLSAAKADLNTERQIDFRLGWSACLTM